MTLRHDPGVACANANKTFGSWMESRIVLILGTESNNGAILTSWHCYNTSNSRANAA
jgi:hypothetical protein